MLDPLIQTHDNLGLSVYTTEVPYSPTFLVLAVQGKTVWKLLLFWFSKYFFSFPFLAFLKIYNTGLYLLLLKHSFNIFKALLFLKQSW